MAKKHKPEPVAPPPPAPPYPGYQEYPKWLRKRNAEGGVVDQVLVGSRSEEDALGEGWA